MSSVNIIHPEDKQHLFELHDGFQKISFKIGCSTAAASFLLLGALIVIAGASLCLTLPGVNVINNVILPGIVPGVAALVLSTPFIIYSVLNAKEKNALRGELIDFSIMLLNFHAIDEMEDEEIKANFIYENLFKTDWTKEYGGRYITDLKERYPKKREDRTEEQENLIKALDDVRGKLSQRRSRRV